VHWVFAYGSNMHLGDLARWLREDGSAQALPARVEPACIADFELAWDYRSVARGGGAANARPRPGGELRGVCLACDETLLAALDRKEGHPHRYARGPAPVWATLLASGEAVRAWLYRVTPAHERPGTVPPRAAYLHLLVQAAEEHGLGEAYIARLRATPTAD
jgi:hypothetical protein